MKPHLCDHGMGVFTMNGERIIRYYPFTSIILTYINIPLQLILVDDCWFYLKIIVDSLYGYKSKPWHPTCPKIDAIDGWDCRFWPISIYVVYCHYCVIIIIIVVTCYYCYFDYCYNYFPFYILYTNSLWSDCETLFVAATGSPFVKSRPWLAILSSLLTTGGWKKSCTSW